MAEEILHLVNTYIVDPYILHSDPSDVSLVLNKCMWSESYSMTRQFFVMWSWIYAGSLIIYFTCSGYTYYKFYTEVKDNQQRSRLQQINSISKHHSNDTLINYAHWQHDYPQIRFEILTSCWSLLIMAGMVAPVELYVMCGGGYVYYNINDYPLWYFILSPFLFIIFTDTLIYWIHRLLHTPQLYFLHKLHHKYKETTPFSAFAFHPIDGYLQGLPYHLFVLCCPMYSRLYALTLLVVGMWTVNIHDRVTLRLYGVNGAAHHTIHHTKFNYNYGQYFTFWDHVFNTYKDPYIAWPYNADDDHDGIAQYKFEKSLDDNNNNNNNKVQPAIKKID